MDKGEDLRQRDRALREGAPNEPAKKLVDLDRTELRVRLVAARAELAMRDKLIASQHETIARLLEENKSLSALARNVSARLSPRRAARAAHRMGSRYASAVSRRLGRS
ncbi:MAG: hypothetical protein Q4P33_01050 [Flaviflexus sp.]|nr:hypothetical protein [Flaviflexus sp.]